MAFALEEVRSVTDTELVSRVERLVGMDRALGAKLLVHLGELDERKLYLERGFSSMFDYCRNGLRMSEGEAYLRIKAARVGRRFPLVLERLEVGAVHLSGVKLLAKHLTFENHVHLLDRVEGWSKQQIAVLVAEFEPQPDVPARLRRLPAPRAASGRALLGVLEPAAAAVQPLAAAEPSPKVEDQVDRGAAAPAAFALQRPRASTKPLRPGRFKLEVTLGEEAHNQLEQLRELLRHQNPSGDLASIVERALGELLQREMKRRFAQSKAAKRRDAGFARSGTGATDSQRAVTASPARPHASRYVPREVLREVFARDGGQCSFVSPDGRRCTARGFLEVHHHDVTFARGGAATADNLKLACRAHNFFLAERDYGREFMQQKLRAAGAQRARPRHGFSREGGDAVLSATR